MKKILLIGNGAREHVIAETCKRSPQDVELCCFASAKNPGIAAKASSYEVSDLGNLNAIKSFATVESPDFAIVGPENPIALGVADMLKELDIPTIAPLQAPAQLESSKSFTRDLLRKYTIPGNPRFRIFNDTDGIREFLKKLEGNFVVKADILMGGKGVKVSGDHLTDIEDGVRYASDCVQKDGLVVIEEKCIGQEFSLMSFSDGKYIVDMPPVQDHKRAYEGDKGPNTGGMGSYSCANHVLPFLTAEDLKEAHTINQAVVEAVREETDVPFKGILYGGFILTREGVRLIEYNVRFGDPEAMNVLPLLKTDFVTVCEAIISGNLDNISVEFEQKATVCKYVVPEGYPDNPMKGACIEIGNVPAGVRKYLASIDELNGELFLSGSRAVAFVGIADTLAEAERMAEEGAASVKGPVFHRSDIGTSSMIENKVEMMRRLRG